MTKVTRFSTDTSSSGLESKAITSADLPDAIVPTSSERSSSLAALTVAALMPSREAIKAATVNAAKLLDLSDEVGTIASGKSADVIALDSSPLDDVSVLKRVTFVMARGDVYRA